MWLTTLTFCIVILSLWITWRKRKLTFFQKLDIPGPPPSLLFGNYWELLHEGQHNCIKKWIEEYGRVFGYYYGLRPVLVVADLDSLRQIQVKDFQKFVNRPPLFSVGNLLSKLNRNSLTVVQGKRWKELRSILTPTFTTSKLRKMSPITNEAVDELLQAVDKKSATGKPFDIYHLYQNLTMDVIARTSLGIHTKAQIDENEPFVKLARLIFSTRMDFLSMLTFSFTEIITFFASIRFLKLSLMNKGKFPRGEMQERTADAIKARRSNPDYRRVDVLQLMMDAQKTGEIANDKSLTAGENEDSSVNEITSHTPARNGKGMTDEEILHNAAVFLLAGFETTSTALAFLTHILVYHQDVQDKVREEINRNVSADEELSYDVVHKLEYLDCVLNESLRLYPPITYFINRQSTEDTVINNVHIPKNTTIQVPVYYLHHDPTLWEDPEIFNPERFSPEEKRNRHPMSFQPFGAGPRNCIGMRFAQMEAKMAIAKLVRKYKLLPKSGTRKEDFKIAYTVVIMRPEEGVVIQAEPV